jgi:hypothetical protein
MKDLKTSETTDEFAGSQRGRKGYLKALQKRFQSDRELKHPT